MHTQVILQGGCPYCSSEWQVVYHGGACPKVKAVEYDEAGRVKRIEFHDQCREGQKGDASGGTSFKVTFQPELGGVRW
jgi:hypothetical protein